jgi:DNA-binding GntR family transcriptional regulator
MQKRSQVGFPALFWLIAALWHLVCQKQACQVTLGAADAENKGNLTFWYLVCQKYRAFILLRDISLWRRFVVSARKQTKAPPMMAEAEIAIVRIAPETSFKNKAYEALKEAILKMDIYATPEQVMLDERALSERLGVSRTPIREAIAMLEQDGFVKTVPRRGIVVVRRTKTEIVDMIRAWAALESMAARLITTTARKKDISALRDFFKNFGKDRLPQDHVEEYSKANIAFHQALISLSESPVLVDMTNDILLHVRGYRQLTIGRVDRTAVSLPEHLAIIEALEERDTELAEKRARDHTLGLAAYVEAHGQELFN